MGGAVWPLTACSHGFMGLLFKELRYSHFKSHVSINTILAFVSIT